MAQSYSAGGANVPSVWAHWRHLANTIEPVLFWPTPVRNPNVKSTHSAVLAQLTAESPYIYNGLFLSTKLPLAMGDQDLI